MTVHRNVHVIHSVQSNLKASRWRVQYQQVWGAKSHCRHQELIKGNNLDNKQHTNKLDILLRREAQVLHRLKKKKKI